MSEFKNELAKFVYMRTYSRYLSDEGRRETWEETVTRVVDYYKKIAGDKLPKKNFEDIHKAILNFEVMPSMRLMWTAGKALDQNSFGAYNCSGVVCDNISVFAETLLILTFGTGVGFSVEQKYIDQLPPIGEGTGKTKNFEVGDSKEAWAESLGGIVEALWEGHDVTWDVSKVRPAGAKLKTFGGTASGPSPLISLFETMVRVLTKHRGRRLSALNVHDLMCKIAEITVCGGVRRCLPEGSKVHTQSGLVSIEDVSIGTRVLTTDGYHEVTNKFDQGVQDLVEVLTQDSSFKCTENHLIAVLTSQDIYEWKRASDLESDDRIIAPSFGVDGGKQVLPSFHYERPKHSTTCKDITIPELDEDMAWLLGLIHGDGCVQVINGGTKGSVTIPIINTQEKMGEKAKEQLERFGINVGRREYDNYHVLAVSSNQLALYLQGWLKKPKVPLVIPDCIQKSPRNIKLAFVSGLMDADGSVRSRPVQVVVTVYKEYAEEIRLLLSSCGVQTRFKALSMCGLKENWQPKYLVCLINGKTKDIFRGIPTLFKNDLIETKKEQYTNSYPSHMNDYGKGLNKSWSSYDTRLVPVTVLSVEDCNESQPTWDLEVEGVHEFFCEGYLMHNSALISVSDLHHEGMRGAKQGQFWIDHPERSMSNNSCVYTHKPSASVFMEEWLALAKSGSGERGILNFSNLEAMLPKRRDASKIKIVNPCCFTGEMTLLTTRGYKSFSSLVGTDFEILSPKGETSKGTVWSAGLQNVIKLSLSNGKELVCTADHLLKLLEGTSVQAEDSRGEVLMPYPSGEGVKVIKIETLGKEEVFDFNEPSMTWGIVNGVVVSNSEIFLRKNGLCNLSEVVIRKEDGMEDLMNKIKIATIIGTLQSTLTNFGKFVSPEWKKNCEEERLLGVSLTGQMDNPKLLTPKNLQELRDYAVGVNARVSRKLAINRSTAVTCTKPSGSVSQLVDSASGFHPRFSPYYLRRVRISASDPLYKMMLHQGVKFEPEVGQTRDTATTWVCEFPVASPKGCITVEDVNAIEQLEQWLKIKENYTEHTVSATIYVNEDEWFKVGNWVFEHFDRISGVSFLPKSDHVYELAPYQEITKTEYSRYKKEEVIIDYSKLPDFEKEDEGEGAKAMACEGDKCLIK